MVDDDTEREAEVDAIAPEEKSRDEAKQAKELEKIGGNEDSAAKTVKFAFFCLYSNTVASYRKTLALI